MHSPSFNRHSSTFLEDTAARVIAEFPDYFDDDDNIYFIDDTLQTKQQQQQQEDINYFDDHDNIYLIDTLQTKQQEKQTQDNEDFEFPSLSNNHASPSSDVFPIFGRDIIDKSTLVRDRNPLWKLMNEEKEFPVSCSSSEADELEGVPEETYCAWTPAEGRCRKSRSAGSKRWKIKDLVRRSNSDGRGRGNIVFLGNPGKKEEAGGVMANVEKFRGNFLPV